MSFKPLKKLGFSVASILKPIDLSARQKVNSHELVKTMPQYGTKQAAVDLAGIKRRRRCSFSPIQVHRLEMEFRRQRYLSADQRENLARILSLTQQQIKIWFQNRRYKTKIKPVSNSPKAELAIDRPLKQRPILVLIREGQPTIDYCWLMLQAQQQMLKNARFWQENSNEKATT